MKPHQLNKSLRITFKIPSCQSGFSLIELLIAMFIGLFLLAGITSSYLSSKKSSIARDNYSILEDNGRIALEVMTKTLEHTGYTTPRDLPLENKFISVATDVSSENCGTDKSVMSTAIFPKNVTVDNDAGDSIGTIQLGDDNLFTDCSGGVLPTKCRLETGGSVNSSKIYNAFYLDGTNKSLMCSGSRNKDKQIVAEGIENMQILYGVDANADNVADRYVSASDVKKDWNAVVSIQVAVLARTPRKVKDKAESKVFTLLDHKYKSPTDRFQRAVFSTTISLRNSLN